MPTPGFKISSYCLGGGCVAVAAGPDGTVVVADSKTMATDGPRVSFTASEWDAFIAGVKNGEFERKALVI
jgi:Domain of unknown function (DUF397)